MKNEISTISTEAKNGAGDERSGENRNARANWSSGIEFLLSCISMSVGLGNVWRFPYVAYENGGGAFLIPYLLLLFVIGRPIYYMEMIVGQFSSRSTIRLWDCAPAFRGLAFAQLFSISYLAIFYNYLMSISMHYLVASFTSTLPWSRCRDEWIPANATNWCAQNPNATSYRNKTWPELYYERDVLHKSAGLWDVNLIQWKLTLCLIATWILVYVTLVKGVQSLGKISYFTALFPYVVLITLLIVSLLQDGAIDGIKFFFEPRFEQLIDPIVWYRAVEQSFFSLAVCFGSLVMYSSYSGFRNNVSRDCVIVSVLDTVTSILAGSVTFAVLGAMAKENGKSIAEVVRRGPGLTFIAYPEGLAKISFVPQLWSVLFFVMLFVLGVGSSVSLIETILTCVKDRYVTCRSHSGKLAAAFCAIFCVLGIPLTTDAGTYIMSLLDNYGVGTAGFLYGILEVTGLMWSYGLRNFCLDLEFMLGGGRPSWIWRLTWGALTPLILAVIFVYGNVLIFAQQADVNAEMPVWGTAIGWALAGIALIQIPIWFVIEFARTPSTTWFEKFVTVFRPRPDYGPTDPVTFAEWERFKLERENFVVGSRGFGGTLRDWFRRFFTCFGKTSRTTSGSHRNLLKEFTILTDETGSTKNSTLFISQKRLENCR